MADAQWMLKSQAGKLDQSPMARSGIHGPEVARISALSKREGSFSRGTVVNGKKRRFWAELDCCMALGGGMGAWVFRTQQVTDAVDRHT